MARSVSLATGDSLEVTILGVKVAFRYCPPGTFSMGSPEDEAERRDDEKQHDVTLTHGFWMLETPVTQALWEAVTGENPSHFKGAERPVESVSWEDSAAFIKRLNEEGYAPEGMKFDFPTEAEWEYACRAGTTTPFNFGSTLNGDKANCDGRYPYGTELKGEFLNETTPVKSYSANAWGFHEMHGGLWEWTSDWYTDAPVDSATESSGTGGGVKRVIRGGSWASRSKDCRSASRCGFYPSPGYDVVGLRLVLRMVETPSFEISSREVKIKDVSVVFRYCPPGTFMMGSPEDEKEREDDETQHEVTLTRGFWMMETPVTQALWYNVTRRNPSKYKGSGRPVESVSWEDCAAFIKRLNEKGYAPEGFKFDFPTEAEWEYACRAGTTTPFNFGSSLNGDKANCNGSYPYGTEQEGKYLKKTTPVKSYPANAWELYDMHGNVWEWCSDWYGDYPTEPVTDPTGLKSGSNRVLRGGSWGRAGRRCRSANRRYLNSSARDDSYGLRLVLRSVGAPVREVAIKDVSVVFRYCPAGTFMMGSPEDEADRGDDETRHEVTLTRGFWMQETPVTQALWSAVTGENPSEFTGADRPVESVSWEDCVAFIKRLNKEGYAPEGFTFDFPTEAEWEYACRAGTTTPFNFGSSLNGDKANCFGYRPYGTEQKGQYVEETTPVKSYSPNAWGLYDMHGNVCELCSDWYGVYPTESATDPTGAASGSSHVVRGGSWRSDAKYCRSASRAYGRPVGWGGGGEGGGMRLVLRAVE